MGKRMLREVRNPMSQTRDLKVMEFQQKPIWLQHLHAYPPPRSSALTVLLVLHPASLGHVVVLKMHP